MKQKHPILFHLLFLFIVLGLAIGIYFLTK